MLLQCYRCGNNLLRITMMIVFGLANLNNGLTSYVTQDNINNELHRNINQNLIMSPASAGMSGPIVTNHNYNGPAPQQQPTLTPSGHGSFRGSYSSSGAAYTASSDMPYPPSSISASSTYYHQNQHQQQQQQQQHQQLQQSQQQQQQLSLQQKYHQTSGSSITSFDSANVIDERHQQRHSHQHRQQQQQQQQQQVLQLQHIARPLHKVVGVGNGGGGGEHNSLADAAQGSSAESMNGALDELYAAPMYFGTENSTVVTTQIGASAHIPCTVHHIGDGVVSWIRKKDYHLLTVGLTTYSSDERFSATHLKHSEDWTLQIKFVQLRDAGVYECQVSTHPPTSIFLHLNVVEARAEISGPPIRYLTPGSTLRLQCRVVQNTEASEFIFWYHDNRMINYDSDRGINVSTDPDFQSSELTIQRTRREHSGNFTCVASNTQPASVLVHIFKECNA
ncbi:ras guanine nucleotide exchange factor V [Ceratitis capitata]|nr:ras guanine nucleotide exchange factor V [Ceratitis capitata]